MSAALLLFAAAAADPVPAADPAPSPWVEGLGELLPVGAHVTVTRDDRNGVPNGPYRVRALTAAEAAALRAEAEPYRGQFEELTNARARLEAASRRELRMDGKDADYEAIERMQNQLTLLRRRLQRAGRVVAAADSLRTIVACGHGRLSICAAAPPEQPPAAPVTAADVSVDDSADALLAAELTDPADGPDPSETARDVIHLPLAEVVQVSESPARFAERTGIVLPGEPAGAEPPAAGTGG